MKQNTNTNKSPWKKLSQVELHDKNYKVTGLLLLFSERKCQDTTQMLNYKSENHFTAQLGIASTTEFKCTKIKEAKAFYQFFYRIPYTRVNKQQSLLKIRTHIYIYYIIL